MKQTLIWRDDDCGPETTGERLKLFKGVHELFKKYNVLHTVALICNGLEENKALVKYLQKEKLLDLQIHCWDHYDFTKDPGQLGIDLPKCIEVIARLFGKRPTTLFPPWNKSDDHVAKVARINFLEVSNKKMSLSGYLKGQSEAVVNLHSWHIECSDLEAALKKYTNG